MKTSKTMIVLANSRVAKFFVNPGRGSGLVPATVETLQAAPPRLYADRAGVSHSRVGPGVSAVEQSDPKAQAEAEFAASICDFLETSLKQGDYKQIVIASGPHMLSSIRKALSEKVSKLVIAELDKDLTQVPVMELPKHFDDVLAI